MPLVPFTFGERSNPSRHGQEGGSRLINAMIESLGPEGKVDWPIYATEGLRSFATTTGSNGCRGLYERTDGTLLAVMGRSVYSVTADGVATLIGGLPSDGPAYFAENRKNPGRQTAVTSGGLSFVAVGATLAQITAPGLLPAHSNGFVDGYTLFGHDDGRFSWSALDEATSVDALDFATAEGSPDGMRRLIVRAREVFLMGARSIEVFAPTGNADSAFERLQGAYIGRGIGAPASAVVVDNLLLWVDHDYIVRAARGYDGERISDHGLERAIAAEPDEEDIVGWAFSSRGHVYYVLSGATFTWVFDLTTKRWHERQSYGLNRWRAVYGAKVGGKIITGDYASDKLYEISPEAYDEVGEPLVWTVEPPPLNKYPARVQLSEIAVDMVVGVGINSTDPHVSDPHVMLSLSKDGGATWSPTRSRSIGKLGERRTRVRWHRNGTSEEDGFKMRLSASAAVVRGVSGASAMLELVSR